jgi:hypothetical protein
MVSPVYEDLKKSVPRWDTRTSELVCFFFFVSCVPMTLIKWRLLYANARRRCKLTAAQLTGQMSPVKTESTDLYHNWNSLKYKNLRNSQDLYLSNIQIFCTVQNEGPIFNSLSFNKKTEFSKQYYGSKILRRTVSNSIAQSVTCIATRYGLEGPGIISRWRHCPHPSWPTLGPTQPVVWWVSSHFTGG